MRQAGYSRHAWILLFVLGLLVVVFGIGYAVLGLAEIPNTSLALADGRVHTGPLLLESPPELVPVFRNVLTEWGIFEAAFGALVMVVAAVPFRRGDRWAWFALWVLPLALAAALLNAVRVGANPGPIPVFLAIALLGLALRYRRFFERAPGPTPDLA